MGGVMTKLQADGERESSASPDIARLERELADVRELLSKRGREIGSIREDAAADKKPFYRQPAIIVASLALVASVIATALTFVTSQSGLSLTRADQLNQQRAQLTSLIQTIAVWVNGLDGGNGPQPNSSQPNSSRSNSSETGVDGGRPNLDEASYLISQLQGTPVQSTPFEKVELAYGYDYANEPKMGLPLAMQAEQELENSTDAWLKSYAARWVAINQFESGDPVAGRAAYARSIADVAPWVPGSDYFIKLQVRMEVRDNWSFEEARVRNCAGVGQLAADANAELAPLSTFYKNTFASEIQDIAANVNTCQ